MISTAEVEIFDPHDVFWRERSAEFASTVIAATKNIDHTPHAPLPEKHASRCVHLVARAQKEAESEQPDILGYIAIAVRPTAEVPSVGDSAAVVMAIAVAMDARRKGIGRHLVERAIEYLAAAYPSVSSVRLQVRTEGADKSGFGAAIATSANPAKALYESVGFCVRRSLWNYYGPEQHAVEMVRPMKPVSARERKRER